MLSGFPAEYWRVMELALSDCDREVLKTWRKTMIGRGKSLRARDFDNAVSGADGALCKKGAGTSKMHPLRNSYEDKIARAYWYIRQNVPPVFARASEYKYTDEELIIISMAIDNGLEPVFLEYDSSGIDRVAGPGSPGHDGGPGDGGSGINDPGFSQDAPDERAADA